MPGDEAECVNGGFAEGADLPKGAAAEGERAAAPRRQSESLP